jgi:hypothetical protein
LKEIEGLPLPLYIEFTFIRGTTHEFDYHNMIQIVADQMKDRGWIMDDSTKYMKAYFGDWRYDKENPGVEIRVLKQKPIHYET